MLIGANLVFHVFRNFICDRHEDANFAWSSFINNITFLKKTVGLLTCGSDISSHLSTSIALDRLRNAFPDGYFSLQWDAALAVCSFDLPHHLIY